MNLPIAASRIDCLCVRVEAKAARLRLPKVRRVAVCDRPDRPSVRLLPQTKPAVPWLSSVPLRWCGQGRAQYTQERREGRREGLAVMSPPKCICPPQKCEPLGVGYSTLSCGFPASGQLGQLPRTCLIPRRPVASSGGQTRPRRARLQKFSAQLVTVALCERAPVQESMNGSLVGLRPGQMHASPLDAPVGDLTMPNPTSRLLGMLAQRARQRQQIREPHIRTVLTWTIS